MGPSGLAPSAEGRAVSRERVQTFHLAEATLATLPRLNCGLCGAPTCREFARDISVGDATKRDCIFLSKERLRDLQRAYLSREEDA
jgi:Na+-translocating ferredoxin:NAD+ oxidoreductase RNF subunit RnfB